MSYLGEVVVAEDLNLPECEFIGEVAPDSAFGAAICSYSDKFLTAIGAEF